MPTSDQLADQEGHDRAADRHEPCPNTFAECRLMSGHEPARAFTVTHRTAGASRMAR